MYVLSEYIKNINFFLVKFLIFIDEKKSLYIAWACFRNVQMITVGMSFLNGLILILTRLTFDVL